MKLYAKDEEKEKEDEKKNEDIKEKNAGEEKERNNNVGDYIHKKNYRSHSLSIDLSYNFYEDENDSPVYDNDEDKSVISSNSSL